MSTLIRRLNGALGADTYEPTSHATESALFHGYRSATANDPVIVGMPCCCGGWVQADPDNPGRGVAQHNSTGRHLAWRSAQGYDQPLEAR